MRRLILFFLLSKGPGQTHAQLSSPLKIGDTIPDVVFKTFYDPGGYCPSLVSLRGKTVILDFWNIGCGACISSMPKMDSLQQMFKDSLQVIYITKNNLSEVSKLFSRISIKKPDVPFVVDNPMFYDSLFPHIGDPLHIWINRKGVIKAVTSDYNATPEHVSQMLRNDEINLALRSELKDFNYSSSLLSEASGRLWKQTKFYSIFLQGLDQITGRHSMTLKTDSLTGERNMVQVINASAYELLNFAWTDILFKSFKLPSFRTNLLNNNRIIIETKDSFWLKSPENGNDVDLWRELYTYSYELYAPSQKEERIFDLMRKDMEAYFPFKIVMEQRLLECLVLKRMDNKDRLRANNKSEYSDYGFHGGFYAKNISLQASLLPELVFMYQDRKTPIVDGTNYSGPVDLKINCQLSNLVALQKELNRYGLILVREKRKIDVLVIKDK